MASGSRTDGSPGGVTHRPRVLVENADGGFTFAAQRCLERNDFQVAICAGPDHLPGGRCPLVSDGACELVAGADVVVHGLGLDRPEHHAVLCALREHHTELPVVVEVRASAVQRHAGVLDGCTIARFPMSSAALADAVRAALGGE